MNLKILSNFSNLHFDLRLILFSQASCMIFIVKVTSHESYEQTHSSGRRKAELTTDLTGSAQPSTELIREETI